MLYVFFFFLILKRETNIYWKFSGPSIILGNFLKVSNLLLSKILLWNALLLLFYQRRMESFAEYDNKPRSQMYVFMTLKFEINCHVEISQIHNLTLPQIFSTSNF